MGATPLQVFQRGSVGWDKKILVTTPQSTQIYYLTLSHSQVCVGFQNTLPAVPTSRCCSSILQK